MSDEPIISEVGNKLLEYFQRELTPLPINSADAIRLTHPGSDEDFRLGIFLYDFKEVRRSGPPQMVRIGEESHRFPDLTLALYFMLFANRKAAFNSIQAADEILLLEAVIRAVHCMPELPFQGDKLHLAFQPLEQSDKANLWQSLGAHLQPAVYLAIEPVCIPSTRIRRIPAVREIDVEATRKQKEMDTR